MVDGWNNTNRQFLQIRQARWNQVEAEDVGGCFLHEKRRCSAALRTEARHCSSVPSALPRSASARWRGDL